MRHRACRLQVRLMASQTEPLKILIADDYPDAAALLGNLFRLEFNCEIAVALNGADALQAALKRRPDVLLLDIDMPVMTGIECAAAMRLKWGMEAGLMVAITGLSSREADKSGHFHHVLCKPPVCVRRRHLESARLSTEDSVHQGDKWTLCKAHQRSEHAGFTPLNSSARS